MQALQGLKYTIVKACTGIQGKLHVRKEQAPAYMFQMGRCSHVGNDHARANIGFKRVSCVHLPLLSMVGLFQASTPQFVKEASPLFAVLHDLGHGEGPRVVEEAPSLEF